jgi:hypothetical protein
LTQVDAGVKGHRRAWTRTQTEKDRDTKDRDRDTSRREQGHKRPGTKTDTNLDIAADTDIDNFHGQLENNRSLKTVSFEKIPQN